METLNPDKSLAIDWYKKALAAEKDEKEKLSYMVSLADLQNELGNREREAKWREQVYLAKEQPTNLDLYKWGMALYYGEKFEMADSVFALYEEKYPDQIYGYLWRAKSNALIDTAMENGLAIPHYIKLAEVAAQDTAKNKAILLGAFEYLGPYEANIKKDYAASLGYFEKILEFDPENNDANRNVGILRKKVGTVKGDD